MKSLSAPALARTKATWASKYYLGTIAFTVPTAKTLRVSDRYLNVLGHDWFPHVKDWGNLVEAMNTLDVGGVPSTVELTCINTRAVEGKARLSGLIRSEQNTAGAWQWRGAKFTVQQLDEGLGTNDEVPLGEFFIDEVFDVRAETFRVRMSTKDLLIEDQSRLPAIANDVFPLADPDEFGKVIGVAVGAVKNVPCRWIVAGGVSTLVVAITASSPGVGEELRIADASRFPKRGTLKVGDEKIEWNDRRTVGGFGGEGRLKVARRGAAGTTASKHAAGTSLAELRSGPKAYRASVAMNLGDDGAGGSRYRNREVGRFMVHGHLVDPQPTVDYDEEFPPGSGKRYTIANFSALPELRRQVDLDIDDGIEVDDNINVTDDGINRTEKSATGLPLSGSDTDSFGFDSAVTLLVAMPSPPSGEILDVRRDIIVSMTAGNGGWSLFSHNYGVIASGDGGVGVSNQRLSYFTGDEYGGDVITLRASAQTGSRSSSAHLTIHSYKAVISAGRSLTKTGRAFRTGEIGLVGNSTVDTVIGGEVTCDIEGLKDDADGTITGTPNALVTNPADVTKLFLLELYPHTAAADIGASFATTRAGLKAAGYRWDFVLTERSFAALRRKLGEQACCALHLESGKWEYPRIRFGSATTFHPTEFSPSGAVNALQLATLGFTAAAASPSAAVWPLPYGTAWWDGEPVVAELTPATEVWERLRAFFRRDYRKSGDPLEAYDVCRTFGETGDARERILELDLIRHAPTAATVANFWWKYWRRQRWQVRGVCFWNALALEKFDVVEVPDHPVLDDHPGLVFRVHQKVYRLADENPARIAIHAIEANQ